MKSMTGFGTAANNLKLTATHIFIEVTIRSVNGRFFEPRFHLPREYMGFESELKKRIQKKIGRGTIDIYVSRKIKSEKTIR